MSIFDSIAKIAQKAEAKSYDIARIGILDPSNPEVAVIQAPGRPDNYVLVRILTGSDAGTVQAARNEGAAPAYDVQVYVRKDPRMPNEYVIKNVDPLYSLANPTANPASVAYHRHYIGSGEDDPVELRRWIPGRVWSSSGLTINIDAFVYQFNGTEYQFSAVSAYDISAYIPGTGLHRYIKIGVDRNLNSITIVAGATKVLLDALTFADIQAISFPERELAAIALTDTQTIIRETDIVDLRDGAGSSTAFGVDKILTSPIGLVLIDANGYVMLRMV